MLFSMDKNNAHGPDNIPDEFIQCCWDIVHADIMKMFHAFHAGTMDVRRLNYGIITLISESSYANKIQPF